MGELLRVLALTYTYPGQGRHNGHVLTDWLRAPEDELPAMLDEYIAEGGSPESLRDLIGALDTCAADLARAQMGCNDAPLVREEVLLAIDWLRHAARQGLRTLNDLPVTWDSLADEQAALIARQRAAWLSRSRPGGLEDSLAKFALRAGE